MCYMYVFVTWLTSDINNNIDWTATSPFDSPDVDTQNPIILHTNRRHRDLFWGYYYS